MTLFWGVANICLRRMFRYRKDESFRRDSVKPGGQCDTICMCNAGSGVPRCYLPLTLQLLLISAAELDRSNLVV
jgi:hypothetical protein